jgi:hypothetical protein
MTKNWCTPCAECGGKLEDATLAGFVTCRNCGKLTLAPAEDGRELALPKVEMPSVAGESTFDPAIPDYSEVMVGWRAWKIEASTVERLKQDPDSWPLHKTRIRLRSATRNDLWEPRVEIEAKCPRVKAGRVRGHHDPPGEACTCGLYTAKTREHLLSMGYQMYDGNYWFCVVGRVSLWGKVVEGTQGWRSEFAYPAELFVPFEAWELATPLREVYGVPVQLNNILA